jgi:NAD(P)-dependent dehydrogenase (short-subunit alcohol dehydrogenase family)
MEANMINKTVLVTGASSGIGYETAIYLSEIGYTVLASVRKEEDAIRLEKLRLENLKPIWPLDLTISEQIDAIGNTIIKEIEHKEIPALYSIINIAGGGQIAPIELMDISEFRNELEKRIIGPVYLLQILLPFLRKTKGRILWIATPGLIPISFLTDIHASDFAVNYIARTLNLELYPDGIRNILIRCGGIKTTSPERTINNLKQMISEWDSERLAPYKNRLLRFIEAQAKFDASRTKPIEVAKLIGKVLEVKKPKVRYQVGHLSKMAAFLEKLPQSWVDYIMEKREKK